MRKVIFLAGNLLMASVAFGQISLPNSGGSDDAGNATGTTNIHIGKQAGTSSMGANNTFIGYESGLSNGEGRYNVFVGYKTGSSNIGGDANTFMGHEAGKANTSGVKNIFNGCSAGYNNTTGFENTFIGYEGGYNNTTGEDNVFIGRQAGYGNTSGNYNVLVGSEAGYIAEGSENTFIGYKAGRNSQTIRNVYVGYFTGINSTGAYNVSMGYRAGLNAGEKNLILGYSAGETSVGNNNIFLGYQAGYNELDSNKLYIANSDTSYPLVYGEFDNKHLKFNANKVGIGTDFGDFPTLSFDNAENYKLFVRGGILAEEVRIRLQEDWADYVFTDGYKLLSLKETEDYINKEGHLPNMPSAQHVSEEGLELGNIITLQQEKIEELTLHTIAQEKRLDEQGKEIELLKSQMQILLSKQ